MSHEVLSTTPPYHASCATHVTWRPCFSAYLDAFWFLQSDVVTHSRLQVLRSVPGRAASLQAISVPGAGTGGATEAGVEWTLPLPGTNPSADSHLGEGAGSDGAAVGAACLPLLQIRPVTLQERKVQWLRHGLDAHKLARFHHRSAASYGLHHAARHVMLTGVPLCPDWVIRAARPNMALQRRSTSRSSANYSACLPPSTQRRRASWGCPRGTWFSLASEPRPPPRRCYSVWRSVSVRFCRCA